MSFHYDERVYVKRGFYAGQRGKIVGRLFFKYQVKLDFSTGSVSFWPWQIGKSFMIRPVDNAETMENVRRA